MAVSASFVQLPGPGQYSVKGIKDELRKKVWGKQGVFGSTEKRFAQLSTTVITKLTGRKFLDLDNTQLEIDQGLL